MAIVNEPRWVWTKINIEIKIMLMKAYWPQICCKRLVEVFQLS